MIRSTSEPGRFTSCPGWRFVGSQRGWTLRSGSGRPCWPPCFLRPARATSALDRTRCRCPEWTSGSSWRRPELWKTAGQDNWWEHEYIRSTATALRHQPSTMCINQYVCCCRLQAGHRSSYWVKWCQTKGRHVDIHNQHFCCTLTW